MCIRDSIYAYIQSWHQNVNYVFVVIAIVFFISLVYVLFFALPFSDTYVEENIHKVCQTGCYALCRHPGFWLLAGMMISLSLSVMTWHMWIVALIVNIGNFIYICYQDKVSFPCQFEDYNEYKKMCIRDRYLIRLHFYVSLSYVVQWL